MGYGMNGNYNMHDYFGNGNGYGMYQTGLSGFTGTIIQLLIIALIVIAVFAAIVWVRNYLIADQYRNGFYHPQPPYQPGTPSKNCASCGRSLSPDWKVCPHCGKEITRP